MYDRGDSRVPVEIAVSSCSVRTNRPFLVSNQHTPAIISTVLKSQVQFSTGYWSYSYCVLHVQHRRDMRRNMHRDQTVRGRTPRPPSEQSWCFGAMEYNGGPC